MVAAAAVLFVVLASVQPASAGAHRIRLTGTYREMAVDGIGWGRTDHYLTSGGQTYLLQRGGDFPDFDSGARVEVDGTLDGTKLHPDAIDQVPGAPVAAAKIRSTPRLPTDTRSVLAILVNWTAPDAVTPTKAIDQLENTNDAWYDDASYGQVRMTAEATDWLTIPAPDGCASSVIMDNALAAAKSAGWDLNSYDHLLVYFPYVASCGYAGMAYVGWGRLWINGYMNTRVTVHELGHNLGLSHAHSVTCAASGKAVPWSEGCTRSEYGDPFDAMGGSFGGGVGRFNASQAAQLGWMGGRKKTVKPKGGTFKLAAIGRRRAGLQALRLPDANHTVWVEYRRPTGVDSWLPSGATNGVLLHVSTTAVPGSDLIDLTPQDDFTNSVLRPGRSWTDPLTGWRVRVKAAKPKRAVVVVTRPHHKAAHASP